MSTFEKQLMALIQPILFSLKKKNINTVSPFSRDQIYQLAKMNDQSEFLKWIDYHIAEKVVRYLNNKQFPEFQEFTQVPSKLLSALNGEVKNDYLISLRQRLSALRSRIEKSTISSGFTERASAEEWNNYCAAGFAAVALNVTLLNIADGSRWDENDIYPHTTNEDLGFYDLDPIRYASLIFSDEGKVRDLWIWWLEEAIPNALVQVKKHSNLEGEN